jgi:hypothetical protein
VAHCSSLRAKLLQKQVVRSLYHLVLVQGLLAVQLTSKQLMLVAAVSAVMLPSALVLLQQEVLVV